MVAIDHENDGYYKYKMKVLNTETNDIDYMYANKILLNIPGMDLMDKWPCMDFILICMMNGIK